MSCLLLDGLVAEITLRLSIITYDEILTLYIIIFFGPE